MTAPPSVEFSKLARDLYLMGPSIRRQLRQRMARIGAPLLADARGRAGWSTRIPSAITVRPVISEARNRVALELRVGVSEAVPHARVYEGMGQGGSFRAPLWGDREHWYPHDTRPYAFPAVLDHRDDVVQAVEAAFEAAARAASFR